jgi:hypothetical protein
MCSRASNSIELIIGKIATRWYTLHNTYVARCNCWHGVNEICSLVGDISMATGIVGVLGDVAACTVIKKF